MKNTKTLWLVRTALFIALLVAVQAVTRGIAPPFGQYVTGSLVNLILILSAMLGGLGCGLTVAVLSPLFAFLLGIGPAFLPIVPLIMLGNAVLVLLWKLIAKQAVPGKVPARYFIALVVAAAAKFAVLYFGVVKIALPLMNLKEAQVAMLSASFSLPQLITAGIGGALAVLALPLLARAIRPATK